MTPRLDLVIFHIPLYRVQKTYREWVDMASLVC
jgi:hypothetical protein